MAKLRNMGTLDRVLRAIVGVVLAIVATTGTYSGGITAVLWILAVLMLGTAAVAVCPAYLPFKVNTGAPRQG